MRLWVALTDRAWYEHLSALRPDEVNFWQPSGRRPITLDIGAPYLFKLHASGGGQIVGGGYLAHWSTISPRLAWDSFGEKNGVGSLEEMVARISHYARRAIDPDTHLIGCGLLTQPFFLTRAPITLPHWAPNIVQGKSFDLATAEGAELWNEVRVALATEGGQPQIVDDAGGYGEARLVRTRLGQGTFRVAVTDAYSRRCAVTGERTLPVLEAAHIKPFSQSGPHAVENGLLLRADVHTLFDRGYITVAPDLTVHVSQRIRQDFENGRDYYALAGRTIATPAAEPPRRDLLEWHGDVVYKR